MTRAYKITRLPDGYCKVAVAAWKALGDRTAFCADEFDSHAAFEKWLLNAVAEWCRNDPLMVDSLDQYL